VDNHMTVASERVNAHNTVQITSLLTNLNNKIRNFSVIDRKSEFIGTIKDVIIDSNRQITFIVSKVYEQDTQAKPQLFLLRGQLVQKIDPLIKKIFLIVDKSQTLDLPEYLEREMEQNTNVQNSFSSDNNIVDSDIADTAKMQDVQQAQGEEEVFRLLEERLVVDSSKRKVGEVIVRKEIETRMVTIPVRRERLIVEQVSPERKELANIDLGEQVESDKPSLPETPLSTSFEDNLDGTLTVSGEFSSPKVASLLLNAIALERNHGCRRIRVTIAVEDEQMQQKYQEWFARTSISSHDNGNVK
jgi:sporulation protein YlmC with PRC-barrel domain